MTRHLPSLRRPVSALILALAFAAALPQGHAAANLVTNGSFESVGINSNSFQISQASPSNLPGWSNTSGYAFLVFPGQATVNLGNGIKLWSFPSTSPDGGNFVLQDGAYLDGTLSQTVSGLKIGTTYAVQFYQAAGQQYGKPGDTTEWWDVSFGSGSQETPVMSTPYQGYTGWNLVTLLFQATATSEVLGFLAQGTPGVSQPPFVGLDGVDVFAVPEPATLALAALAVLGIVAVRRKGRAPA